jgi:hypothetical protein
MARWLVRRVEDVEESRKLDGQFRWMVLLQFFRTRFPFPHVGVFILH